MPEIDLDAVNCMMHGEKAGLLGRCKSNQNNLFDLQKELVRCSQQDVKMLTKTCILHKMQ